MKRLRLQRRTLALIGVMVPLLAVLAYVALRSGPLAPVAVTETTVDARALRPALFGIGTVEVRYTYRIGPTAAGRLLRLDVHVGDRVEAGQVLGELDPVDLDARIRAQQAQVKRTAATLREANARLSHAETEAQRYEKLYAGRLVSEEATAAKRQESSVADAVAAAAREDLARARADLDALHAQRGDLRLVAPVAGIVVLREADPGTTIVAGQAVVELIDPQSLWINTRFDQASAAGLAAGLPARIELRSRRDRPLHGRIVRVEPRADAITEETLAKVVFDQVPSPLPPLGELAEVTVDLAPLPAAPVISNAALRRQGEQVGVWRVADGRPQFVPVTLGRSDLDGRVQVVTGLEVGERIVLYSERMLGPRSRVRVLERIPGTAR